MSIAFWRKEYETGNSQIDRQHKHLFDIINVLHNAMMKGEGKDVLKPTLYELIKYTKEHFATEEKLMQSSHYPHYHTHKLKHDELTAQVLQIKHKFDDHEEFITVELSKFLTNWLVHHIKGDDQQMIKFLQSKNKG